jgi:hypothetical protein
MRRAVDGKHYILKHFRVQCKQCNETVESTHRHDFKSCSCGNVSVDGGVAEGRLLWGEGGYVNVSVWAAEDDPAAPVPSEVLAALNR